MSDISDIVKDENFFKERLFYYLEDSIVEKVLNELIKEGFSSKYFMYDCEITDSVEYAVSLKEKCEFCDEVLNESENHVISESYRLNSHFLSLIREQRKENLNKFLDPTYIQNLERLKSKTRKLIPFIGAGVSVPFNLPDWGDLLLKLNKGLNPTDQEMYEYLIKEGDYFRALSVLKTYSVSYSSDVEIKRDIKQILKSEYNKNTSIEHNVNDILKLESQFFVTTDYDNILSEYRGKYRDDFVTPLVLKDLEDVQDLFSNDTQQVIHLHGNIDIPSSMIVSEEDYEKLYNDSKIESILNAIMANSSLLFIGFSFKDKYFKDLYKMIHNNIKREHFIIVANLHPIESKDLLGQNLIPINLKIGNKDEYTLAIKTILEELY
ncbi:SIR2 family protein [Oceanobacillus polygoni]|uniref:SIR2-like protein n=1 Tax=Oceanobacillus polygoni TaxID=1235259 RepID=A0A9X0YWG3_9BACI|nr:SIR2 family protein [Oceanobacillus polygoni]MBP2080115.1 hypothetical protein [Oceanobacillus polygoni]